AGGGQHLGAGEPDPTQVVRAEFRRAAHVVAVGLSAADARDAQELHELRQEAVAPRVEEGQYVVHSCCRPPASASPPEHGSRIADPARSPSRLANYSVRRAREKPAPLTPRAT